jgi:hypothetical protein
VLTNFTGGNQKLFRGTVVYEFIIEKFYPAATKHRRQISTSQQGRGISNLGRMRRLDSEDRTGLGKSYSPVLQTWYHVTNHTYEACTKRKEREEVHTAPDSIANQFHCSVRTKLNNLQRAFDGTA